MFLIYKIVNFKKINLNDAVKFINKYGYKTTMAVKMSGSGMGFRIYDEKQKCGILSQGGKSIRYEVIGNIDTAVAGMYSVDLVVYDKCGNNSVETLYFEVVAEDSDLYNLACSYVK